MTKISCRGHQQDVREEYFTGGISYLSLIDKVVDVSRPSCLEAWVDGWEVPDTVGIYSQYWFCVWKAGRSRCALLGAPPVDRRQTVTNQAGARELTAIVPRDIGPGRDHGIIVCALDHLVGRILDDIADNVGESITCLLPGIDSMEAEKRRTHVCSHDALAVQSVNDIPSSLHTAIEVQSVCYVPLPEQFQPAGSKDGGPDTQNHIVGADEKRMQVGCLDVGTGNGCDDLGLPGLC